MIEKRFYLVNGEEKERAEFYLDLSDVVDEYVYKYIAKGETFISEFKKMLNNMKSKLAKHEVIIINKKRFEIIDIFSK